MNDHIKTDKGWKECKLGDVTYIIDPHPSHRAPEQTTEGVPFVGIGDLTESGEILHGKARIVPSETLSEHANRYKLSGNSIGFGRVASIGKVIDFPDHICGITVSPTMAIIEPHSINRDFLLYSLSGAAVKKSIDKWLTGSTRSSLGIELLRELPLSIPKKSAQEKIGRIIRCISNTIEKTEALIHKYQQIKAGLMHDLFARGLTADGKLRPPREQAPELYQETPIGWIPKEWKAKKLKDILIDSGGYLQTGPFGSQLHAHEYTHEGVPVVMPQDINDGEIATFDIARIPEKRAQILNRHRLKIGDIIIARRGELSRAAAITEVEKTWVCGTGCFLLRLGGSKLDARFFSFAYRHDMVQRQVAGLAVGTTMPSLNNTVMNALYFPYIGINEQKRIAERFEIVEQQIESRVAQATKLKKQKSGLMHDLLTGKVPVTVHPEEVTHGA